MEVLELQEPEVVWESPTFVEDMLILRMVDGELRIATRESRLRRAREWIRQHVPPGVSLADELSAERREAAKYE
jgi:hypothetical protein